MLKLYVCLQLLFFLLIIVLSSCSQLKPEEPKEVPFEDSIRSELSYLSAPIVFSVRDIEDKINNSVKEVVVNDNSFNNKGGDNVKLRVTRRGDIKISVTGNDVYYSVPLNVHFEGRITRTAVGITVQKVQALDFALRLAFKSSVSFGKDWKLNSRTNLQNMQWISRPVLRFGPLKIQLATHVEKELQKQMPSIEANIDYILSEKLKIDEQALKIWKDLQKPILVNRRHKKIWLKANPVDFYASPIWGNERHIVVNARMSAYTETLFGDDPVFVINEKLPALKMMKEVESNCDLNILSRIPYDEINEVLDEQLKGKTLKVKGHEIKINKVRVYGSGKDIIVRVDIRGDVKGTVYFKGVPEYSNEEKRLLIRKFDFDVHTEEVLLSAADWLLHETFREKVQQALNLPIGGHIEKIPELVQKGIEKGKLGERISLALDDVNLHAKQIVVRADAITVLVNVKGKVVVKLDKI